MADKYTKVADPSSPSPSADAWKDSSVEREHQPAKVTEAMTYRQKANEVANIDTQIASLQTRKSAVEAEMAKIEAVVKPK